MSKSRGMELRFENPYITIMNILFPETFEDFYFRFHRVWFAFSVRERRMDSGLMQSLEEAVFLPQPERLGIPVFSLSPPEAFSRAADVLIRKRLGDTSGRMASYFSCPLSVDDGVSLVLGVYFSVRIRLLLERLKDLESLFSKELFGQDQWRLNKALNMAGQVRLGGLSDDRQETVRSLLSSFYRVPAVLVLQSLPIEDLIREVRQSLDHIWDVTVPAGRHAESLHTHKNLCSLSSSDAGLWPRLFFFLLLLDHSTVFFRDFAKGSRE